ncbi:hypothetical protein HDV00_004166 [Rhizophlyctis rosea]|nr:hypothetical protein HDV00_004166 [Rhizophlyctis rosea]
MVQHHLLTGQLLNSFRSRLRRINVPHTTQNLAISQILYNEGFLTAVMLGDKEGPFAANSSPTATTNSDAIPSVLEKPKHRRIWLDLKYREGEPVLRDIRCVSKGSRRVFASVDELKAVAAAKNIQSGLVKPTELGMVTIINTPFGILELKDALKKDVGGEVLLYAK